MSNMIIQEVETAKADERGCCYYLCKCFYSEEEAKDSKPQKSKTPDISHNNLIQSESFISRLNANANNNQNIPEDPAYLHVKETTANFIIQSQILNDMIEIDVKMRRDPKVDIKYNCPICLRYFNHILQTSCCQNYICKFCAEDYLSTIIKYQKIIKCPICSSSTKIVLSDVKLDSQVNKIVYHLVKNIFRFSNSSINRQKPEYNKIQLFQKRWQSNN